jgi:tetratricopeptide (TPR) repeat protein/SAM-dependent methyltransferase
MTSSTVAVLEEAARLHRQGALADASSRYRQVLESDPDHAGALYHLAVIGCQQGEFDRGIELVRRSLASDPRQPRAHNLLGMALGRLGRQQEALASFDDALLLQPDFADAHGNRASALMELGRAAEAVESYERALALQADSVGDWLNLGSALHQLGRHDDAITSYERALALRPEFVDAHFNRGNVLAHLARYEEALAGYDRVLTLNRRHAAALSRRGHVLATLGRIKQAIASFEEVLALAPDYPGALADLVHALLSQERDRAARPRALAAVTRALASKETGEAKALFVECIRNRKFTSDPFNTRPLMLRALAEPWDRPADLAMPAVSLVKLNPAIRDTCARAVEVWPVRIMLEDLSGHLRAIADDGLLRVVLETVPVCDVELERLLTGIRSICLSAVQEGPATPGEDGLLRFFCSLARQCFINEYVFDVTSDEVEGLRRLREKLTRAIASGGSLPVPWMVALACYLPLHSLPGTETLLDKSWSPAVTALLRQQVREPLEERLARSFIPHLTAVADEVSLKVKQQYEENPYPRWVKAAPAGEPASIRQYFGGWFKSHPDVGWSESIDILVAGCGTGQNLVETARQFRGARVLAVDLSVASLCYAKCQALALGLTNIAFAEADILELASIDRKFDIVDASGVLHHVANPWVGWRVLLSLLRPNGFMRVGLYSKLARADVNAARAFVKERGYAATAEDIRRSRQDILALPEGEVAKDVANSPDFFTTSECRDMLFHVHEYQMTLSEIADFIAENGIEFLGFIADASIVHQFQARFPQAEAMADLALWDAFETDNPGAFAGMYQFWVRKKA